MKPVRTEHTNCILGAGQEQYNELPVHRLQDAKEHVVMCFELDLNDIAELTQNGCKIWVTQLTFNNPFQPIMIDTKPPYDQPEKEGEEYEHPD